VFTLKNNDNQNKSFVDKAFENITFFFTVGFSGFIRDSIKNPKETLIIFIIVFPTSLIFFFWLFNYLSKK